MVAVVYGSMGKISGLGFRLEKDISFAERHPCSQTCDMGTS